MFHVKSAKFVQFAPPIINHTHSFDLSPVHTSDNVAKNRDIVAETGDNVAETGDVVAKNRDIVAVFGDNVAGVDGALL